MIVVSSIVRERNRLSIDSICRSDPHGARKHCKNILKTTVRRLRALVRDRSSNILRKLVNAEDNTDFKKATVIREKFREIYLGNDILGKLIAGQSIQRPVLEEAEFYLVMYPRGFENINRFQVDRETWASRTRSGTAASARPLGVPRSRVSDRGIT